MKAKHVPKCTLLYSLSPFFLFSFFPVFVPFHVLPHTGDAYIVRTSTLPTTTGMSRYLQNIEQQLQLQDRKGLHRRALDHGNSMGRYYLRKAMGDTKYHIGEVRPESSYLIDLLPAIAYGSMPTNPAVLDVQSKFVHLSLNKAKHSINTVKWTPEGRRLVVASHSGEFTVWNGMTFNFETIMQAHDLAVLSLKYSHDDEWLLSGDQEGLVKYWQPNFNNVNIVQAHTDAVRDIAFSPNDSKFLTCLDDSLAKIWSFNNAKEERTLSGHHWDIKCADWHPNLGLVVTGSKDNLLKLWDPRVAECVTTLHGFKNTVMKTKFQKVGTNRLLASVSRDRSCRVFDLRTMSDFVIIRDAEADLSSVEWHPVHAGLLTTGAYDGSMAHYILDKYISPDPDSRGGGVDAVHRIPYAHEKAIHALEYHPLGHILCSAGNDRSARFWSRARPNDPRAFKDPPYTNDKNGAWYYSVNNNVNAVLEDTPASSVGQAYASQADVVPGLRNLTSNIPGLGES